MHRPTRISQLPETTQLTELGIPVVVAVNMMDIVKKNGGTIEPSDVEQRDSLIEEMTDVLMYYNDVMLCYGITVEELKKAYTEKFKKNMSRW